MAHRAGARGKKAHPGGARSPDKDHGRSTGAARHPRTGPGFSIPIALKVTALIAILVIAAMAWQAKTAVQKGVEHLEVEINDNGIAHALAIAGLIAPEDVNDKKRKKLEDLVRPYSRNSRLLDISIMPSDRFGTFRRDEVSRRFTSGRARHLFRCRSPSPA